MFVWGGKSRTGWGVSLLCCSIVNNVETVTKYMVGPALSESFHTVVGDRGRVSGASAERRTGPSFGKVCCVCFDLRAFRVRASVSLEPLMPLSLSRVEVVELPWSGVDYL